MTYLRIWLPLCCSVLLQFVPFFLSAQNCDVDFPGTASVLYSTACGGGPGNLTIGKNVFLGNGDTFIFDAPSTINITGNVSINADGSGKIIIPAGVTVNISGNFQLNARNSGCSQGTPCVFEIVVNGTLHFGRNFQNDLSGLVWSGTGSVVADDHFDNSNDGCMSCGATGCPVFTVNPGDCDDDGDNCSGDNFCTLLNQCATDTQAPVISGCPANITADLEPGQCTKAVTWTAPTASDNCSLLNLTSDHTPGAPFPVGKTTVKYTARDSRGNTATCSFDVTVNDKQAPVIAGCPSNISISVDPGQCTKAVTWTAPTASDNCTLLSLVPDHASGSTFPIGSTTVTYVATDNNGNTSTCSFEVSVRNNESPVITGCPEDISLEVNEDGVAFPMWTPPTASVTCGAVEMVGTYAPGAAFSVGRTSVVYTATTVSGNTASCTFDVIVSEPKIDIEVIQLVTPDGDGKNDVWTITNIEKFLDNEVEIVDRWGSLIYKAIAYDNENVRWDGSNRGGNIVPSGTYFYKISINQGSKKLGKTGFIEVIK